MSAAAHRYLRPPMAKLFAQVTGVPGEIVLVRTSPFAPWTLEGAGAADVLATGRGQFSVVLDGRSHRVLVQKVDREQGVARMRIGGRTYVVRLQDEQARLMKTLGLDKAAAKAREVKAPMPGLVLNVLVKPGDAVKKNDPVLVLEAMKMENVIRAPGDGVVKGVPAEKGRPVEKGQPLVLFE
jgi:biotin carboxyl carrier protein